MKFAPLSESIPEDLLPDVRRLLAFYRDRAMSAEELAARLHQQDECAVQAALEALRIEGKVRP
jgi:hypothetical protein